MKNLREVEVKGKRVIVRCDFNVPLDNKGGIKDDFRIIQSLPTIEHLLKEGAKVILMSHLGKPEGRPDKRLSLSAVAGAIEQRLGKPVKMAEIGEDIEGELVLLENLRFCKGEEDNDPEFSKKLAGLADIYVNDAFGVCHREHASVAGITSYLPSVAGLLLEKEIKTLSRIIKNPERPSVAIIGGAKISSKSKVIKKFLKESDHLLLGGKIANALLAARGLLKGEEEAVGDIDLTSKKIHYPIDAVASFNKEDPNPRFSSLAELKDGENVYDIGPDTIRLFSDIIKEAKTIVWAGPLGMIENPNFEKGTKEVGEEIVRNSKALKVAGGGDTNYALLKFGLRDKFDHVSTGGGAMLAFLAGGKLPGLESLGYEAD